jgi:hypothetical protein
VTSTRAVSKKLSFVSDCNWVHTDFARLRRSRFQRTTEYRSCSASGRSALGCSASVLDRELGPVCSASALSSPYTHHGGLAVSASVKEAQARGEREEGADRSRPCSAAPPSHRPPPAAPGHSAPAKEEFARGGTRERGGNGCRVPCSIFASPGSHDEECMSRMDFPLDTSFSATVVVLVFRDYFTI